MALQNWLAAEDTRERSLGDKFLVHHTHTPHSAAANTHLEAEADETLAILHPAVVPHYNPSYYNTPGQRSASEAAEAAAAAVDV